MLFGFRGKKTLASVTVGAGGFAGVTSRGINSSGTSTWGCCLAVLEDLFEKLEIAEMAENVEKIDEREVVVVAVEAVEVRSPAGGSAAPEMAEERFENMIACL